jgi:hypothetical protein
MKEIRRLKERYPAREGKTGMEKDNMDMNQEMEALKSRMKDIDCQRGGTSFYLLHLAK